MKVLTILLFLSIALNAQDTLFWDMDSALSRNQDLRRFDIYHNNTNTIDLPDTNMFIRIDTVGVVIGALIKPTYMWLFNTLPGEHTYHWILVTSRDHTLNESDYSDIIRFDAQFPQTPFNIRIRREINAMPGDTLIIIIPK